VLWLVSHLNFKNLSVLIILKCVESDGRTEFGIRYMIFHFLVNVCVECFSLHGTFRSSPNGDTEVRVCFYSFMLLCPLLLSDFI